MDLKRTIGFPPLEGDEAARERLQLVRYINLKLAALGFKAVIPFTVLASTVLVHREMEYPPIGIIEW